MTHHFEISKMICAKRYTIKYALNMSYNENKTWHSNSDKREKVIPNGPVIQTPSVQHSNGKLRL